MITPQEIREKAEKNYPAFLRASVLGELFFPLEVRFGTPKGSIEYKTLQRWVESLRSQAKESTGNGYSMEWVERDMRLFGRQSLPARIFIETETDYLKFIHKQQEFKRFRQAVDETLRQFPSLREWLGRTPQRVLEYLPSWGNLLHVCAYFVQNPRPEMYIRELPLNVHTKFIEQHTGILRQLLDVLLPAEMISIEQSQFERRYHLRYDEPLIRLRLLDERLQQGLGWPVTDMSAPVSQLAHLELNEIKIVITENKMNFLTLPAIPRGMAIWGGGFRVGLLRDLKWLADCPLWYWGDIDTQGFEILSQLRGYFPHTSALMMDEETVNIFREAIGQGTPGVIKVLSHLTPAEESLYQHLAANNFRLEQEKISQAYVCRRMGVLLARS